MVWTLDRDFFRSLVGLYAVTIILAFVCAGYESFEPAWSQFSEDFDLLVDDHFGAQSDAVLFTGLVLALLGLAWHLTAVVSLRSFRRWARWSFWASMALMNLVIYGAEGVRPSFGGPLSSIVTEFGTGLFAMIVLLSYSSEHGAVWFRKPLETLKEIF